MNVSNNEEVTLSIVIAAWNDDALLRRCLSSLEEQTDKTRTEVIVISNFQTDSSEKGFSLPVKLVKISETATVPELRREGIAIARGKIVALLEDHCFFDSRWCEEIKRAHETSNGVIGGSVENASIGTALNWAVYFYDYGKYMLPNQAGVTETLSGLNVSYKRTALEEVREVYRNGFYETFVNEELKKRGHRLLMMPTAIMYHNKNYETKRATEHCYYLARSFAARRVAGSSLPKRAFATLAALVLPLLLPARIIIATIKKGRHIAQLVRSLPYLILLMFIWSFGEFSGYLLGEGDSTGEWK